MLDCNRLIDPVVLSFARFEPRVSLGAKRCSDVGHQNLGMDLLLDGVGQFSGEALQMQAAFERLEGFLNAPTSMVERGKLSSREFLTQGG